VQYGLALTRTAGFIPSFAMLFDLRNVPFDRSPSSNLPLVFSRDSATHKIAAIPLEPPSGIVLENPTFSFPNRERLACVHAKIVEFRIVLRCAEFCFCKPRCWKFFSTIRHVLAAEDPKLQHLLWGKFRSKPFVKVRADRFCANITIPFLHAVIHSDDARFHGKKDSWIWIFLQKSWIKRTGSVP